MPHCKSLILAAILAAASFTHAQAPGTPIEKPPTGESIKALFTRAIQLRTEGKLLDIAAVAQQSKSPRPGPIASLAPARRALQPREVAQRARAAYVRVGWFMRCTRCEQWHMNFSGGYAIAPDTVVTCAHVLEPGQDMREGFLVAVDTGGTLMPVKAVLAYNREMDTAVVRVEKGLFTPLPLNDRVTVGDPAFCFSEPLRQPGYFSDGIVNRFYRRGGRPAPAGSAAELGRLRMNVSTDWAPGSSGAAILDECGNAIGHVSTIAPLREGGPPATPKTQPAGEEKVEEDHAPPRMNDRFNGAVLITLHEAIPAKCVMTMVEEARKAASVGATHASPSGVRRVAGE